METGTRKWLVGGWEEAVNLLRMGGWMQGNVLGDGNVLYLHLGSSYMSIFNC